MTDSKNPLAMQDHGYYTLPPTRAGAVCYAALYGGWSMFIPFLSVMLRAKGLTPLQIGLLSSIAPFCTFAGAPLWTWLMDSYSLLRPLLITACALSGLFSIVIYQVTGGVAATLAVIAFCFTKAPIGPTADRSTLKMAKANGVDWGKQRLWGAVTWGILAPLAGLLYDAGGVW
eukprot:Hpha_TRINITY_DN21322_c0_g1::TRINITY_DN21322_c0_g1_i1::g.192544::m.192544